MRQSSRPTTLLHIDSGVLEDHSVSRRLSAALVEQWRGAIPTVTVVYRDLGAQPPTVKVLYQIGRADARPRRGPAKSTFRRRSNIMIDVAIIVGSTRPGRNAEAVANWIHDIARKRSDARFELVDIQDFNLPLLDEAAAALWGNYAQPHTKAWAAKIDAFDAFVFVTPEYNHGPSGALKNAIDFLYREWNNKAAGFVGYGGAGGSRAVEQLRLVMAELQVATVRAQVGLSLYTDFENFTAFKPAPRKETTVTPMLDQLVAWGGALKALRQR